GYTSSQYRTIGFNTNTQSYANPESGSTLGYSYYQFWQYAYLPDMQIRVENPYCISCPQPSDLSYNNLGTNSIDVYWDENGHAVRWEVVYGYLGFDPNAGGTRAFVTDLNTTFIGLSEGTSYDWYVRATCDSNYVDLSDWTKGPSFTTPCGQISSLPWADNFESHTQGLFPNQANNNGCWTLDKNTGGNSYCDAYRAWKTTAEGSITATHTLRNYSSNYPYSYSEQIYEPQDFGLERGQQVYVTNLAFRPYSSTSTYNYVALNYYLGHTSSISYPSFDRSYFVHRSTPLTQYRTSTDRDNINWNSTYGGYESYPFNMNGGRFLWNTDYNMVVGVHDRLNSYYTTSYYTYLYYHTPANGSTSYYRTMGMNSGTQSYMDPGSSNFGNSYNYSEVYSYLPDTRIEILAGGTVLLLNATSSGGYASALTPALNIPLNSVAVNFKAKAPNLNCRLEVGVMDVPGGTFTPVDTIRPFVTDEFEE
ncbi:MAG TPA: hypothetical protein PK448_07710, partial [Bacteroidales bacterium]|nr:hypothetical protein [Bacteroidales bacterium]